jgi:O-antigen/teichoic acid export membrane protein
MDKEGIAKVSHTDLIWNICATILKVASAAILLPFILKYFSNELVGIWTIFMAITTLIVLIDFGFSPTFTRNLSYIFSGAKNLQTDGIETITTNNSEIDYGLLQGLIGAMKWLYSRGALFILLLSATLGTGYISYILRDYSGDTTQVFIAWIILCVYNTYNFYTLYYESLLMGKGMVKTNKQIIILGRLTYLAVAIVLILCGAGLVAVVASQFISTLITRVLSYKVFFTKSLQSKLAAVLSQNRIKLIKTIYPNAVRIGLVYCGNVLVMQSTIFIGSFYLDLNEIGSFGITLQLVTLLVTLSKLYLDTFFPKIVQYYSHNDFLSIKQIYKKGKWYFFTVFLLGGVTLLCLGNPFLQLIGSKTSLISSSLLAVFILFLFLDTQQLLASNILLAGNKVPFLKSNLITGLFSILLIFIFLTVYPIGLWALILGPGIAQIVYQDWKWTVVAHNLLKNNL